jgi:autotransporter-associated beta strand protein
LNLGTGAVTMTGTRQITTLASTLTIGGAISGATFGITKNGAGTLIVSNAANTYDGTTTINAGRFELRAANGSDSLNKRHRRV